MADTYYYDVVFSVKDTVTGIIFYPKGVTFTLSTTEQAMYHIEIFKNGTRVEYLTDTTTGDNKKANTKINGSLVNAATGSPIKGQTSWSASQDGSSNANWLCYVNASGTALVKPNNPLTPGLVSYQSDDGVWHWMSPKANIVVPTTAFSVASSTPPKLPTGSTLISDLNLQTPSNIVDASNNAMTFTVPTGTTFVSPCVGATTSYWVSPLIIPVISGPAIIGGNRVFKGVYTYELRFYNKDGSAGAPSKTFKTLALLNQAVLFYKSSASCPSNVVASTNVAPSTSTTGSGIKGPVTFNPPNNKLTRTEPFVGGPVALGYIQQDDTTAATINTDTTGKYNTKWGFRFTYNPTTFSYGTQSSSALDPTTFAKDPANLIGGNTMVMLQLYLNRIADFSDIISSKFDEAVSYGSLNPGDKAGILSRGTEYDLEFLYRVVNGNPRSNLVLGKNAADGSADFGYITGVPFILHLNDNLEYYCSIQTLTVNHVMFNTDMIPILSTVDLSLMRYPGLNTATEMATITNLKSANATINQSLTVKNK